MSGEFLVGMSLSLLLGALLGVQREIRKQRLHKKDFAGFRTNTFITLFGFLVGYLGIKFGNAAYVLSISLGGIFVLVALSYYATYKQNKNQIGLISQVVAILGFVIGLIVSFDEYQIAITLTIVITTILFLGHKLHSFAKQLKQEEVFATLKFAIISLIILPLLPNKNYSPLDLPFVGNFFLRQTVVPLDFLARLDVFNFYYLWLMVVFISGIAYVGYILMKTIGAEKGILLTGLFGGLMSSTALTSSFSIESRKYKSLSWPLAIGVIIASSVMFFRVLFEVAVLNPDLFWGLFFSLGIMGLVGLIISFHLYYSSKKNVDNVKDFNVDSPFSIGPALKFAFLFLFVMFLTKLLTLLFGNSGIYIISFISGITDVDAIVITLSRLALDGSIGAGEAQFGIIIASFANTMFKGGIAYFLGSRDLFKIVLLGFGLVLFAGGIMLVL